MKSRSVLNVGQSRRIHQNTRNSLKKELKKIKSIMLLLIILFFLKKKQDPKIKNTPLVVTGAVLKLSSVESGSLHVIQQINAFSRTLRTRRMYSTHI